MRRLALLATLALGVLAALLPADAQQAGKVYRIGFFQNSPPTIPGVARNLEAFRQGLSERGWAEGQNIVIEYRFTEGRVERLPSLAAELVSLKVDLIVAGSTG